MYVDFSAKFQPFNLRFPGFTNYAKVY